MKLNGIEKAIALLMAVSLTGACATVSQGLSTSTSSEESTAGAEPQTKPASEQPKQVHYEMPEGALAVLASFDGSDGKATDIHVTRDGQPLDAKKGIALKKGDGIEVGEATTAVLHFADSEVALEPKTKVRIGSIDIDWGKIFIIGPLFAKSKSSTASAEGTAYYVNVAGDSTEYTVMHGRVNVCPSDATKDYVAVTRGERTETSKDQKAHLEKRQVSDKEMDALYAQVENIPGVNVKLWASFKLDVSVKFDDSGAQAQAGLSLGLGAGGKPKSKPAPAKTASEDPCRQSSAKVEPPAAAAGADTPSSGADSASTAQGAGAAEKDDSKQPDATDADVKKSDPEKGEPEKGDAKKGDPEKGDVKAPDPAAATGR